MLLRDENSELRVPAEVTPARRVFIYGINYAPEPTGVGRYTGQIGAYLARQGMSVEVMTAVPHYPGWSVREGYRNRYSVRKIDDARVTHCPLLLKSEMRKVWRMIAPMSFAVTSGPVAAWRILRTRPNTVLCVEPTLFSVPVAILAAKIVGARTVLHVQDMEVDAAFAVGHLKGNVLQRLANFIERRLLHRFDAVVTISQQMQQRLKARGVADDRLYLVRNWVDVEQIRPLDEPSIYRRELGISDNDFVALYAGNIGPKQALPVVLDAAEQMETEKGLVFVVAGDGPEKSDLIARYGRLSNVRFLPVQPEGRLCELLNLADVHLLPQGRGAADIVLPSKLGGMLASGKPSIVMAEPGSELHEYLGDGAILLEPGDSRALADAIRGAMHDATTRSLAGNSERLAALDARRALPAFKAILTGTDHGPGVQPELCPADD